MKKSQIFVKLFFLFVLFFALSATSLLLSIPSKKIPEPRTKAAGNTLAVCPEGCQYSGPSGLQQAADAASDGDIINISGTLMGSSQFSTFKGGMNVQSCFVDLKGKDLTLRGGTLYGEGHAKGLHDQSDPLFHRAGICSTGGTVTIDGVNINEFEGGGIQFHNTTVILKNNTIQGNDHGSVFLYDSPIIAINNVFVSNIGFMPFGSSPIKAYNNTFYWSKAILAAISCRDNVPPVDFVNNIVVDPEITIGIGGLSTSCPEKVSQFKDKHIAYNLQWKGENKSCYGHEYCEKYLGLINIDPKFDICVQPQGFCGGSLDPQINVAGLGDPAVPGTNGLGKSYGPCVDGNSSVCLSFIEQEKSQIRQSEPPTGIIPTSFSSPLPDNPPPKATIQPSITQSYSDNRPPITYYLPPTMSFASPNQTANNQPNGNSPSAAGETPPTPTITPTPKPLIDVAKTVSDAKNSWNNFVTSLVNLSKTILP